MGKLKPIQAVRFFGFLLIFTLHSTMFIVDKPPQFELMTGSGVLLFLALSGAMGAYSISGKEPDFSFKGVFNFVKKKLAKFYPLYIITNLFAAIYYGPTHCLAAHDMEGLKTAVIEFVEVVFMVQPFTRTPFAYNGVSWFLAALMWFSLLAIPLEVLCSKIRKKKFSILIFSLGVIGCFWAYSMVSALANKIGFMQQLSVNPATIIWGYIAGVFLGNISIELMKGSTKPLGKGAEAAFTLLEAILPAMIVALFFVPARYSSLVGVTYVWVYCGIIIVFMLGRGKVSHLLSNPVLVGLGNISFECYMIHQIVIHEYCQNNGWDGYGSMTGFVAYVFCLILSLFIAYVINKANIVFRIKK